MCVNYVILTMTKKVKYMNCQIQLTVITKPYRFLACHQRDRIERKIDRIERKIDRIERKIDRIESHKTANGLINSHFHTIQVSSMSLDRQDRKILDRQIGQKDIRQIDRIERYQIDRQDRKPLHRQNVKYVKDRSINSHYHTIQVSRMSLDRQDRKQ